MLGTATNVAGKCYKTKCTKYSVIVTTVLGERLSASATFRENESRPSFLECLCLGVWGCGCVCRGVGGEDLKVKEEG